ncbi:GNAT family N-acetyltransferase [Vibrio penaeicida]|uniref:N-acetyltransferase n=1 Tax=Vibrio penaeicida TaxID=104609 RepID=A0AAV5NKW0_9VIBR|nr:GNAT family N-acetyltransferase [Vibrio penaeicida]RTZ23634.1 N-acetyltransferase [Vibrio penaeicida]GLQ70838.1 N-acetyltransferase [Vibrio penaeicida]
MENRRIRLAPPTIEIAPQMLEAVIESKKELEEYLPWVQHALTLEQATKSAQEAVEKYENFVGDIRYSIICKESGTLLGAIGLIIRDQSVPFFEIGYWLRTSAAGKGVITEAVALLETYAFEELGANRIEIKAAESNQRSWMVAVRCGYQLETTMKNTRRIKNGDLDNTVIYVKTSP